MGNDSKVTSEGPKNEPVPLDDLRKEWLRKAAAADVELWSVGRSVAEVRAEASRLTPDPDADESTRFYLEAARAELQRLESLNADLMKLKEKAKVAQVVRKHSSAAETFESLAKAARAAMGPLGSAVREALYYRARGSDYHPEEREDWDGVRRAIENGHLEHNAEENGVRPSDSDAKVRKAMEALDALEKFLERPPADFHDWYASEHDDAKPDIGLRPFWEEHLP